MDLAALRHEDFAARIGDRFDLDPGDGNTVALELSAATQAADDRPDHAHFVEWTGPPGVLLEQRTYRLRHTDLGTLDVFLVPVGQAGERFVYEAVFTWLDG